MFSVGKTLEEAWEGEDDIRNPSALFSIAIKETDPDNHLQ
jgi:hypothetical protein